MTTTELNKLLASAREAPLETSVEEVTGWVDAIAVGTLAGASVASLIKLFIIKKALIMSITLGIITTVAITVGTIGSTSNAPVQQASTPTFSEHQSNQEPNEIAVIDMTTDENSSDSSQDVSSLKTEPSIEIDQPVSASYTSPATLPITTMQPLSLQRIYLKDNLGVLNIYAPVKTKKKGKGKGVKGNGNVIVQDRTVSAFEKLEIAGIFDVIIHQGTENAVSVETDENLQEFVVTKNEGNTLTLTTDGEIKHITKMIINVTVKNLTDLIVDGIGDVTVATTLTSSNFTATIGGVGETSLDLKCTNLTIDSDCVGDITLKGTADKGTFDLSGVGEFKSYDMKVNDLNVDHDGVGSAYITALKTLNINFEGVGSVYYKGGATVGKINSDGIGEVKEK